MKKLINGKLFLLAIVFTIIIVITLLNRNHITHDLINNIITVLGLPFIAAIYFVSLLPLPFCDESVQEVCYGFLVHDQLDFLLIIGFFFSAILTYYLTFLLISYLLKYLQR